MSTKSKFTKALNSSEATKNSRISNLGFKHMQGWAVRHSSSSIRYFRSTNRPRTKVTLIHGAHQCLLWQISELLLSFIACWDEEHFHLCRFPTAQLKLWHNGYLLLAPVVHTLYINNGCSICNITHWFVDCYFVLKSRICILTVAMLFFLEPEGTRSAWLALS